MEEEDKIYLSLMPMTPELVASAAAWHRMLARWRQSLLPRAEGQSTVEAGDNAEWTQMRLDSEPIPVHFAMLEGVLLPAVPTLACVRNS